MLNAILFQAANLMNYCISQHNFIETLDTILGLFSIIYFISFSMFATSLCITTQTTTGSPLPDLSPHSHTESSITPTSTRYAY